MQASEHRFAQAHRNSFHHTSDYTANGVAFGFDLRNQVNHFLSCLSIGATHYVIVDFCQVVFAIIGIKSNISHLRGVSRYAYAKLRKCLTGKCTTHHTRCRFACRRTATTAIVAQSIL